MIKLYQFQPIWDLPNASPFCMKLETYLKMAEIPYETVIVNSPSKGPKGKLPFIEDEGKKLGDSSLIIQYLKKKYGDSLDSELNEKEKAIALSLSHLVEDHLFWILVYSRWAENINWECIKKGFFAQVPPFLRNVVPELIRKRFLKQLEIHGFTKHSREEIYEFGKEDIVAISALLDNQAFCLGEKPTSIDATLYAFLSSILFVPYDFPLKMEAQNHSNLIAYCTRMKERYYP